MPKYSHFFQAHRRLKYTIQTTNKSLLDVWRYFASEDLSNAVILPEAHTQKLSSSALYRYYIRQIISMCSWTDINVHSGAVFLQLSGLIGVFWVVCLAKIAPMLRSCPSISDWTIIKGLRWNGTLAGKNCQDLEALPWIYLNVFVSYLRSEMSCCGTLSRRNVSDMADWEERVANILK